MFFFAGKCSGAELFHVHRCFIDQLYRLAARPDVLAETVSRDLWHRETEPVRQVLLKALLCICHHYQAVTVAEKRLLLYKPSQRRAATRHSSI